MHKTVKTTTYELCIEVEEFYFDDTRPARGFADTFTGVSNLHTTPVPAWGDANVLASLAQGLFIERNTHAPTWGYNMTVADYRRLEECGYFK